MLRDIIIPCLGESISEVTIASLLVETGSYVQENQSILEVESEKVNQVVYAPVSGVVSWDVALGDIVPVGSAVGTVKTSADSPSVSSSCENSEKKSSEREFHAEKKNNQDRHGEIIEFPGSVNIENKKFVPLPHPLSHQHDKKQKKSSGVESSSKEERKPMSSLRKTIARRLVQSLNESAMLTTFNEINMDAVIAVRQEYKDLLFETTKVRLGFMSFFISAVTRALKEFSIINTYLDDDYIVYRKYYNIGVAVSTDKGLVVPVIKNSDTFSLIELEKQLALFAKKARESSLSIEDLSEGGFTITNAGVFGSLLSTPIINPPQVGILGMHKIEQRPVVIDNKITIANMMYVALSYDHRVIDGKDAVSFLMKIKELIERPDSMEVE